MKTIPCTTIEIAGADRLIEHGANARIGEDHFDQHRAGNQLTEDECQGRRLRQEGIADRVAKEDGASFESFGIGIGDIVFASSGDHHGAHSECPAAERDEDDRQRGKDRMIEARRAGTPGSVREGSRSVATEEREEPPGERRRDRSAPDPSRKNGIAFSESNGGMQEREESWRARPTHEGAEERAEDPREERRRRQQDQRPRHTLADDVADALRIVGDRVVEVSRLMSPR